MPEQTIEQQLAELRTWAEERATAGLTPLQEEQERQAAELRNIVARLDESVRSRMASDDEPLPELHGTPLQGIDAPGAVIAMSLIQAQLRTPTQYAAATINRFEEITTQLKAALDSTSGEAWIPTGESSIPWDDVHLQTRVAGLLPHVSMPTNPYEIPVELGNINFYPGVENTAATPTDPAIRKETLTAYELVAAVPWSLTLEEDSIVPMLNEVRRTLTRNVAEVIDDVLLNADSAADTTNINNLGTAFTAATAGMAHYLIGAEFASLVKRAHDATANGVNAAGKLTLADIVQARVALGKYAVNPRDVVMITDIMTFLSMITLDSVQTVDKFGPGATILSGQLGAVYGIPIIVSEQLKLAGNTGAVEDSANDNEKGRIIMTAPSRWRYGTRRRPTIESERDLAKRQTTMYVSMRLACQAAQGQHTVFIRNITV